MQSSAGAASGGFTEPLSTGITIALDRMHVNTFTLVDERKEENHDHDELEVHVQVENEVFSPLPPCLGLSRSMKGLRVDAL